MRTWRVGSFSMGAALILLGVFLLLAQFFKWDPAIAMISWWPLLFIILGVEILLYLGWGKSEKQYVKYDFISIIFISIIGMFGLGMAMLNATGVLEVSKQFVNAEERTLDLPKFEEMLTNDIKRVQIQTGSYHLNIEGTEGNKAVMFGTYRGDVKGKNYLIENVADYAQIEKQADTLYVKMKRLPTKRFMNDGSEIEATLLIPTNVELEVVGEHNDLNLKPRNLQANWSLTEIGTVNMDIAENADLKIQAIDLAEAGEIKWKDAKKSSADSETMEFDDVDSAVEETGLQTGTLTYGPGAHTIQVKNSYSVRIK